jgi:hypothetical protein
MCRYVRILVTDCRRVLVYMFSRLLLVFAFKHSYFFKREPECVRAELGRGARPGLASFQVLTRTLWMYD